MMSNMTQTVSLFIFCTMVFILGYSLGARVGFETAAEGCKKYHPQVIPIDPE